MSWCSPKGTWALGTRLEAKDVQSIVIQIQVPFIDNYAKGPSVIVESQSETV